ncbi:unnamed protein product [Ectocarpus sp. 12 AP-2014]
MKDVPQEELNGVLDKIRAMGDAAECGSLDSSHYRAVDFAVADILQQLSPIYRRSPSDSQESMAEETKEGDLRVQVDPASCKKFEQLLAQRKGPLRNLVTDEETLRILAGLFPTLRGDELSKMLTAIEEVRDEVEVQDLGKQEVDAASGEGEDRVQHVPPGVDAQGGDLDEACSAASDKRGMGLFLPVSGGVSRADDPATAVVPLKDQTIAARVIRTPGATRATALKREGESKSSGLQQNDLRQRRRYPAGREDDSTATAAGVAAGCDASGVEADWEELVQTQQDIIVPVSLFVMCKTVVEDDGGGLFLNGTLVQRVLVKNVPTISPSAGIIDAATQSKLKSLLFPIHLKGPLPGGNIKHRTLYVDDPREPSDEEAEAPGTVQLCAQTLDLISAPLDVRQHWNRFPFRILEGTIELELQSSFRHDDFGSKKILLCPDLLHPVLDELSGKKLQDRLEKIIRIKPSSCLSRLRRLAFLRELPVVELCYEIRLKKGVRRADDGAGLDNNLLIRYPQLTLRFWLYEPVSKAIFKIVGPLTLVLALMLMNFEEFFGISAAIRSNECLEQPASDTYSDYLANGIGIVLAAFFAIPSIREGNIKSPGISFKADDCMAVVFLFGLALSNVRQCRVALVGIILSCLVVVWAVVSFVWFMFERRRLRKRAEREPLLVKQVTEEKKKKAKPRAVEFDKEWWTRA